MNLAWKGLRGVLMQNEKENTQHLDKECVQKAMKSESSQLRSKYLKLLEPRLDIKEHLER